MTYEQINIQLKPILNGLIERLKSTEEDLNNQMEYYKNTHIDWLKNNDYRPGSFSRILSAIVASKFTAVKTIEYLNQDNWQEDYRDNHMPAPWKEVDYFGHFKEIALLIRFHLIHSVYSQIETTNRIIIRVKGLRTNTKPATSVNELTNTYNQEFVKFIDFIRNTIHNNGFHYPNNPNNNSWTYNFNGKNFHFEVGQPIELEFTDTMDIVHQMINDLINTLRHPDVENIGITADIT
ncbi:MAG: hypothetical protein DRJ01_16575 [Bacteroidetes bacterium]|nr:MAG: hypothetical protein DRJ01_16575 [Bacteroidota bacterium]